MLAFSFLSALILSGCDGGSSDCLATGGNCSLASKNGKSANCCNSGESCQSYAGRGTTLVCK